MIQVCWDCHRHKNNQNTKDFWKTSRKGKLIQTWSTKTKDKNTKCAKHKFKRNFIMKTWNNRTWLYVNLLLNKLKVTWRELFSFIHCWGPSSKKIFQKISKYVTLIEDVSKYFKISQGIFVGKFSNSIMNVQWMKRWKDERWKFMDEFHRWLC
jgi:hypothetical protein